MIREVCSCGAEFETDHPDQVDLVKNWRKSHKHFDKVTAKDSSVISDTSIALGFQVDDGRYDDE